MARKKLTRKVWTIVQHSGAAAGNPQFEAGLEVAEVSSTKDVEAIEAAGGLVFTNWAEATHYEETEPYPPGHGGLIPEAPGAFSPKIFIGGLALYLPVRVSLAMHELRELLTQAALIGLDIEKVPGLTRGDVTHQVELNLGHKLRTLSRPQSTALICKHSTL